MISLWMYKGNLTGMTQDLSHILMVNIMCWAKRQAGLVIQWQKNNIKKGVGVSENQCIDN